MLRRVTYLLQTSEHLYAFKSYRTLEDETMMTIAQAQKWVRGFANSVTFVGASMLYRLKLMRS